jgi:pullulanase
MLRILLFLLLPSLLMAQDFSTYPYYVPDDLGAVWQPQHTTFKLWSPGAEAVKLRIFQTGHLEDKQRELDLGKGENGTWVLRIEGDWHGFYYTYQVKIGGKWLAEAVDPYAKTVGVNGKRGMVYRAGAADPEGWTTDKSVTTASPTSAILYEIHVRDATLDPASGILNRGKFLGLAEKGGRFGRYSTGLDHIKELGVTHVHILPMYDYASVDESKLNEPQFNWGYDPLNYNAPEGSYSTDPYNGEVRVRELKTMVMAMHQAGLGVVMDVVYNHTMFNESSNLEKCVPGYYYRHNPDGSWSNASGCGNETASERAMMRKYMIESLVHWTKEYHLDGFRFDLMGIHDIETMNEIATTLRAINPSIVLYGEGWTSGGSPLPEESRAIKRFAHRLDGIAVFCDDLRDGAKGTVFDHSDTGFASGKPKMEQSIRFGIVAATKHPDVKYAEVNYSKEPFCIEPSSCVNYVECHDNHTLWDRLANSRPDADPLTRMQMHQLSQAIVLTSQGVPFLHAGMEFMRTKNGIENSFNAGDSINMIRWERKAAFYSSYKYTQGLIKMRKEHPMFRLNTSAEIAAQLRFIENTPAGSIAYVLTKGATSDSWARALVAFNGTGKPITIEIPEGKWRIAVKDGAVNKKLGKKIRGTRVTLSPYSALIVAE